MEMTARAVSVGPRTWEAFRPLWDRATAGWFVYDADGELVYANAAVERLTATKPVIGSRSVIPTVVPESRASYARVIERLRSGSTCEATQLTLPVSNRGLYSLIRVQLLPLRDGNRRNCVIGVIDENGTKSSREQDPSLQRLADLERAIARIAREVTDVTNIDEITIPDVENLSPRQQQILQCLAAGQRPTTIASNLHLSVHTVRNHTKAIFRALGIHSQAELLVWLGRHGLQHHRQ